MLQENPWCFPLMPLWRQRLQLPRQGQHQALSDLSALLVDRQERLVALLSSLWTVLLLPWSEGKAAWQEHDAQAMTLRQAACQLCQGPHCPCCCLQMA